MDGFINVLKPVGMTSHDVVARLRRILGTKKIGHTGTLDPGVAGVLPICVGKATRLSEYLLEQGKRYLAEVTFGIETDSYDAYGEITAITQENISISPENFQKALAQMVGAQYQIPPMTSAVKQKGKKLYELARQGIEIERKAREIMIYEASLRSWRVDKPVFQFELFCSKGTYVRNICHDLGKLFDQNAYMSFLIRIASGPFLLADSWPLEKIKAEISQKRTSFLLPLDYGLVNFPLLILNDQRVRDLKNGKRILVQEYDKIEDNKIIKIYDQGKKFHGLVTLQSQGDGRKMVPRKMFVD